MAEKISIKGIIRQISKTSGSSAKGEWVRAAIKIDKPDGHSFTVSTFDSVDSQTAELAKDKEVEATYEENGKFKNLCKGGIKVIGVGEAPVTHEEAVEEGNAKPKEVPKPQYNNDNSTTGYWVQKLAFDKEQAFERQKSIVRQNSWTQAQTFISIQLKAVELGIIPKDKLKETDINAEAMAKLAHTIEDDINDPKRVPELK